MYYVDGSVPLYKFDIFRDFEGEISHGISTRHGGVSEGEHLASLNLNLVGDKDEAREENYRRFADAVGVEREKIVVANQRHTDQVMIVDQASGHPHDEVDGFLTQATGLPVMVRFADCQGALFFDPVKKVVGAVHCGWRGNAQNILGKTVRRMASEYASEPKDILVGIGPSLEPEAAEFSDPFNELPEEMHKYVNSERRVDLWQCSEDQLRAEGVDKIEIAKIGTFSDPDQFFSYRYSGGNMGHMGGVIMLK